MGDVVAIVEKQTNKYSDLSFRNHARKQSEIGVRTERNFWDRTSKQIEYLVNKPT